MKEKITCIAAGVLFLFAVACSQKEKKAEALPAPSIPDEWLSVDNEYFSVRFPPDWELADSLEGVVFYLFSQLTSPSDTFRDNINLVMEDRIPDMSLDGYMSLAVKNLTDKFSVKITEKRKYIVDGQIFYHLQLQWNDGVCLTQHYYLNRKTAYILSFTFQPDEMESIRKEGEKTLMSFRIK